MLHYILGETEVDHQRENVDVPEVRRRIDLKQGTKGVDPVKEGVDLKRREVALGISEVGPETREVNLENVEIDAPIVEKEIVGGKVEIL